MCIKKRYKKKDICAGDLRHKIELQAREVKAASYNQDAAIVFTSIGTPSAKIVTVSGTSRFSNINIVDGATHLFIIKYTPKYKALETGNNFVLFNSRRFRILEVSNSDEDDNFLIIQTAERGDDGKDAAKA